MEQHNLKIYFLTFALLSATMNFLATNCSFAENALEIANAITPEAGVVTSSWKGKSDKAVLIFQETHISRVGQTEIALMLTRLYNRYRVKAVAIEGAFVSKGVVEGKWFYRLHDRYAREEAALQLLRKGEISAGEFITLAIPAVKVCGVEKQQEYAFDMSPLAESASIVYLFAIAEKLFPQNEAKIIHANRLAQELERAPDEEKPEKLKKLMDYVVNANQWTKRWYKELTVSDKIVSTEEVYMKLKEIKAKAEEVNADVGEYEEHLDNLIKFYKRASKRTETMIDNTLRLCERVDGIELIPVIMGAAHTAKACAILEKQNVSYVVISPLSLAKSLTIGDLRIEALERKRNKQSVDELGLLGPFLDGRWKPSPTIGQTWLRSEGEFYYICNLLAGAVASGGRPPFESLQSELANLRYIRVDPASFEVIGDELIFKVIARTNDPGRSMTFWARVALLGREERQRSLEDRLREMLEELRQVGVETREREGELFTIGLKLGRDLDASIISSNLRREFQNAGVSLSLDATISIEKAGSTWVITDRHQIFHIQKTDSALGVSVVLKIMKTSRNVIAVFSERPQVIRQVTISG